MLHRTVIAQLTQETSPLPSTDDRLRQLFESFSEAPLQASLQFALAIMSTAVTGSSEDLQEKYLSIGISVLSMGSNFIGIIDGAKRSEEPVATYVAEVLSVGVGHIPHIVGIREGRLEEADFSQVPEKLLLEDGGQGLKRIFDAFGDGGMKLKRVKFAKDGIVHELKELVEPERRGAGNEEAGAERSRYRNRDAVEITVTLSAHSTEAEGLFIATLLEARAGLGKVVLVRKFSEREREE